MFEHSKLKLSILPLPLGTSFPMGFATEEAAVLEAASQYVISEKLAISKSLETEAGGQDRSVVETPSSQEQS